jgi:hypothetical protein
VRHSERGVIRCSSLLVTTGDRRGWLRYCQTKCRELCTGTAWLGVPGASGSRGSSGAARPFGCRMRAVERATPRPCKRFVRPSTHRRPVGQRVRWAQHHRRSAAPLRRLRLARRCPRTRGRLRHAPPRARAVIVTGDLTGTILYPPDTAWLAPKGSPRSPHRPARFPGPVSDSGRTATGPFWCAQSHKPPLPEGVKREHSAENVLPHIREAGSGTLFS